MKQPRLQPVLQATPDQLEKWLYWRERLPPMQVASDHTIHHRYGTHELIPSDYMGTCRGYLIAMMDEPARSHWVEHMRTAGGDPAFRIFSEHDVRQMLALNQSHQLAKSAHKKEDIKANDRLLERATRRTGCGRAIIISPYFPIDFTGKSEFYHCERCGRLDGMAVVPTNETIKAIVKWRKQNLMEVSHVG